MSAGDPLITFLSDYGLADEFVGVCHGVIARRAPEARVIDIAHGIPRQDVSAGAAALLAAVPFMPTATHLAIVDPGVGATGPSARRAVAIRTAQGSALVGPDNGLLMAACEHLGGAVEAVDIGSSPERLEPVSHTFHGRDVFAPVAGALAAGAELRALGQEIAPAELAPLALLRAAVRDGALHARVLRVDTFGNVILDARAALLAELGAGAQLRVCVGAARHAALAAHAFADVAVGELMAYEDSSGLAALAVNLGSAAERLGARAGDELAIEAA